VRKGFYKGGTGTTAILPSKNKSYGGNKGNAALGIRQIEYKNMTRNAERDISFRREGKEPRPAVGRASLRRS